MKYGLTINSDNPADIAAILAALGGNNIAATVVASFNGTTTIATDAEDDETGPVAAIAPGELDVTGLPWDERIHAGTKTKTAAGNWKKRKGTDESTITAVEGELRARASVQTAPGVVPPPTAPVVTPPPAPAPVVAAPPHDPIAVAVADGWILHPTSPGYYYKGQDVQTTDAVAAKYPAPAAAPSAPAAPVAPAATGPKTFGDLMQAISNGVAANKIDTDGAYVGQLAAALGVGQITEVAASPDKIEQAFAKLAADGKL